MLSITRELPFFLALQLNFELAYLHFKGFDGGAHIGTMGLNAINLSFTFIKSPFSLHNKRTQKIFNGGLLLWHQLLKTRWWLQGISLISIRKIFMVSQAWMVVSGQIIRAVVKVTVVQILALLLFNSNPFTHIRRCHYHCSFLTR